MALTDWDDLELCTIADLKREAGKNSVLIQQGGAMRDATYLQSAIDNAKIGIFNELSGSLPDLFASRNGQNIRIDSVVRELGWSYTDLDTMFDKIMNPTVLNDAATALSLQNLAVYAADEEGLSNSDLSAQALLADRRDYWDKQYAERMKIARNRLIFDLNDDGVSDDQERVRTRHNFQVT